MHVLAMMFLLSAPNQISARVGGTSFAPDTERVERATGFGRRALDLTVGTEVAELFGLALEVDGQLINDLPDDEGALEVALRELRLRAALRVPSLFWRPLSFHGGLGVTSAWVRSSARSGEVNGNAWVNGMMAFAGARVEASPDGPFSLFVYGEYGYALREEKSIALEPADGPAIPLGRVDFSGPTVSAGAGFRF